MFFLKRKNMNQKEKKEEKRKNENIELMKKGESSNNTESTTPKNNATQTKNFEKNINEKPNKWLLINFHAYVSPEFKVDIEHHEFGIISSTDDWERIKPLKIIS